MDTDSREFSGFLSDVSRNRARINEILTKQSPPRLIFSIDDLRQNRKGLSKKFQRHPFAFLPKFKDGLVNHIETEEGFDSKASYQIGVEGSLGDRYHLTPANLTSDMIGRLVCIRGMVIRASPVHPKIVESVQTDPSSGQQIVRKFEDETDTNKAMSGMAIPMFSSSTNERLIMEFGLSEYVDFQFVTLQETVETARVGQIPATVEVILQHDLASVTKPGDRVTIYGVPRTILGKPTGMVRGYFRTYLIANNVIVDKDDSGLDLLGKDISETDERNILEIANSPNVFSILSRSVAPSIFGHETIKAALILQLLSGNEKELENGIRLRGNVNVLLMGDPSTAKSQLLRFVMRVAPLSVSTTGRGSTGVGLTAAVVVDKDTRERRLEAGALVLADRGICLIDEFDKMSEIDRVAIHEVMEQQCVTIAKAGIHATLNARCSILAAANPAYGQYDRNRSPAVNIQLPDSILSRFDLLFIILDTIDVERDKELSKHVLNMHIIGGELEEEAPQVSTSRDDSEDKTTQVYVQSGTGTEQILSIEFLRKYLGYAKSRYSPVLSESAAEFISHKWARLREQVESRSILKTLPITPRLLETLIRLSTAHAKLRLREKVAKRDAQEAYAIVKFALFHESNSKRKLKRKKKKRPKEETENEEEPSSSPSRVRSGPSKDLSSGDTKKGKGEEELKTSKRGGLKIASEEFRVILNRMFSQARAEVLEISEIVRVVTSEIPMEENEVIAELESMDSENKVSISGDLVYLI